VWILLDVSKPKLRISYSVKATTRTTKCIKPNSYLAFRYWIWTSS